MGLTIGSRLGVYEVTAQIGEGGMGQVYRARDTKLGRDVAIKILPEVFAHDPERLARFDREAKTLAALNHPNIAAIYGFEEANPSTLRGPQGRPEPSRGTTSSGQAPSTSSGQAAINALVMELVEGPTLADVIADRSAAGTGQSPRGSAPSGGSEARQAAGVGPRGMSIDDAMLIARQLADALEAAHEHGIIHRDLKPANVKVRDDGTVKVLDFGLAKLTQAEGSGPGGQADFTQSPTITTPAHLRQGYGGQAMTQMGVILGTAAYMSPEQARGKAVDKRADIWAFGVVFYEMLTGKRLFQGEDVTETLAAVVKEQPDLGAVPFEVRRLLSKCLEKSPKQRLRDIGDVWELLDTTPRPAAETNRPVPARSRLSTLLAAVAGVLAIAVGTALWAPWRRAEALPESVRFQVLPPEQSGFGNVVSVSPDGRTIAFLVRGAEGQTLVWVRSLESIEARPLAGTEGAANGLFWSPDSRFIGFGAGNRLRKVEVSGGPPQTLCDLPFGAFRGGAWNRDGVIIAGTNRAGLFRVSEAGSVPVPLTALDSSRQETGHGNPAFLPDGRHFVYSRSSAVSENSGTYLGSLERTPDQQDLNRLLGPGSGAVYAPSPELGVGYLLFERERTLMAQAFDTSKMRLVGDAAPVGEDLNTGGPPSYSVSTTGVLAYRTGRATEATTRLIWFDRQGRELGQVGAPAFYAGVYFADARRLIVSREDDAGASRLWTADLARGVFSRLNPGDALDTAAAVSPDGRVAFSLGTGDIYVRLASGVGEAEPLVRSATVKHPNNWSLDGRFLIYDEHHPTQRQDLWIVPMEGAPSGPGSERKPVPFLVTAADETAGQFSPDGKWIAYDSDESGRREVYVQGFAREPVPAAAVGKWTISSAGGQRPRWRRDGKELYYIAPDGRMMAVPLQTTATTLEPGAAVPLFETNPAAIFIPYAVTPAGRFLINTITEGATPNASPITVVLNWQSALGAREKR